MAGGLTVAIGGLGAIGAHLARALDAGVEGLSLVAVAARDRVKAERTVSGFRAPPVVALPELAERADIVVEAAPAEVFAMIASAAIGVASSSPASVGALLPRMELVHRAHEPARASWCRPARCSASMRCVPRLRDRWTA